jgi:secreted PhoX family phosphatase
MSRTEEPKPDASLHFHELAARRISRRMALRGGAALAATLMGVAACADEDVAGPAASPTDAGTAPKPTATQDPTAPDAAREDAKAAAPLLGFAAVPKSLADVVTVPKGYSVRVIYRLGDPLDLATPEYPNDGTSTDLERRAGDHHDGMELLPLDAAGRGRDPRGSDRALLVMNHENVTTWALHAGGGTAGDSRPRVEIDREIAAHGLSVVEVARKDGRFAVDRGSPFNRRITGASVAELRGPLRGNALGVTRFSPDAKRTRGTVNNCGTGTTPWGTVLSGEENWASYVYRAKGDDAARLEADPRSVTALRRYGATEGAGAFAKRWDTGGASDDYARWDGSVRASSADGDYRNVLNTFGYMVEVDGYAPASTMVKRSALGRMAHEGAAFLEPVAGQPLAVYMGDDSRDEYIYKFVSKASWSDADRDRADRLAVGDKYLDEGTLYVAKLADDGTGAWIELTFENPAIRAYAGYAFADQADVVVHARLAADAVGATKMDRPEWCATNPATREVYFTLTNNSRRTSANVDGPNPRAYDDTRGEGDAAVVQRGNVNGHVLRIADAGGRPDARTFTWDVYLFGAEASSDGKRVNLSGLVDDNDFSSPDGLWFSHATGICWIQTDDGAYTDRTNCMMLAGLPGRVGDGGLFPVTYDLDAGDGGRTITARVGKKPTTATLKRFLVGPAQCEITGICETPDGRALFVNIQHPGEDPPQGGPAAPATYASHWPDGGAARPRSATIVITKDDGGIVGT